LSKKNTFAALFYACDFKKQYYRPLVPVYRGCAPRDKLGTGKTQSKAGVQTKTHSFARHFVAAKRKSRLGGAVNMGVSFLLLTTND